MSIPLYVLLFVYGVAVIIFIIFFAVNIYHIVATGTFTYAATVITTVVIALSIAVLVLTVILLRDTQWSQMVTLWGSSSGLNVGF
ncbi:MAG TPA: hypothetical protein DDW36_02710 [Candidatus Magasanikbacteria bacterium]|nr:hypothetical protein [Candidatus Magasanikbacteria bacterium]